MPVANVRSGINSLMAEMLEITSDFMCSRRESTDQAHELAEDLMDLVRVYLK
jgi:hypothetical protein